MSARAAFRQADLRRAIHAVESEGKFVRAVDILPEGGFRLLTASAPAPPALNDDEDWVALAGAPEISRA